MHSTKMNDFVEEKYYFDDADEALEYFDDETRARDIIHGLVDKFGFEFIMNEAIVYLNNKSTTLDELMKFIK